MRKHLELCHLAFAVIACACIVGCSPSGKASSGAKGAVRVGDEWITHEEIVRTAEAFRAAMPGTVGSYFEAPDSAQSLRDAAKQLVLQRVMLHEVKARGLMADTARARLMFGQIRKRFPDEATFQRELTKQGQTEDGLRKQISDGLLVDTLMKSVTAAIAAPTMEDCRKFYDENPGKFSTQKNVRLSQIFVAAPSKVTAEEKKAARGRAEEILRQASSGGDFGALAREKSQGPEASSQGDMGWFSERDLNPNFAQPASALAKGQVSGIIESEHGFHILRKTDEKMAPGEPFDKARPQIEQYLQVKGVNDRLKKFVDSLVSTVQITYADTAFAHVME